MKSDPTILKRFYICLQVCGERHRFETLMDYFKNYEEFHIDFMVSLCCMPCIDFVTEMGVKTVVLVLILQIYWSSPAFYLQWGKNS